MEYLTLCHIIGKTLKIDCVENEALMKPNMWRKLDACATLFGA